jgi:hypothetical protein
MVNSIRQMAANVGFALARGAVPGLERHWRQR